MQVCLDEEGWPVGAPEVFLDLRKEGLNPDGAVTDADGTYWLAQWGASRIAAYGADGVFKAALSVTTTQSSCPALSPGAFFVTSSADGVDEADGGKTFRLATNAPFKPEPGIIL